MQTYISVFEDVLEELQLDFQYFDPALWDLEALDALCCRVQQEPSKVSKLVLDWCRLGDSGARCVCLALARHAREQQGVKERRKEAVRGV